MAGHGASIVKNREGEMLPFLDDARPARALFGRFPRIAAPLVPLALPSVIHRTAP